MNATIKPITAGAGRCEHTVLTDGVPRMICRLTAQFRVVFVKDPYAETENDLCYQHATERLLAAMNLMSVAYDSPCTRGGTLHNFDADGQCTDCYTRREVY